MVTKSAKKAQIRTLIMNAAHAYAKELAGKVFLYVYGNDYLEISFRKECFLHFTGVDTSLSANDFYKKAKSGKLNDKQFFFSPSHSMGVAKKKLPCLIRLPELTSTMVCILKDMTTVTLMYKIGVTNLEFTLGVTENVDAKGNKIDNLYLPRTLRVKDRSVERSKDGDIVDFIFMREAVTDIYKTQTFADSNKKIPRVIENMIDSSFYQG